MISRLSKYSFRHEETCIRVYMHKYEKDIVGYSSAGIQKDSLNVTQSSIVPF